MELLDRKIVVMQFKEISMMVEWFYSWCPMSGLLQQDEVEDWSCFKVEIVIELNIEYPINEILVVPFWVIVIQLVINC